MYNSNNSLKLLKLLVSQNLGDDVPFTTEDVVLLNPSPKLSCTLLNTIVTPVEDAHPNGVRLVLRNHPRSTTISKGEEIATGLIFVGSNIGFAIVKSAKQEREFENLTAWVS